METWVYFLIPGFLLWAMVTVLFALARTQKDNSIIDSFYGLLYVALALSLPFVYGDINSVALLITFLLLVWGFRLSQRIIRKNLNKPEDWRYQKWREQWLKQGYGYFVLRSYLQIFLLQGFVVYLVSLPLVLTHVFAIATVSWLLLLGFVIWLFGFVFEVVADHQLDVFVANPDNKNRIMHYGLFRYSRRPNYFGEACMWWGIALIAASSLPLIYVPLAFLSPFTITYIVYFVTGPLLEAKWQDNFVYQEYAARTNYFFPWFPKLNTYDKQT